MWWFSLKRSVTKSLGRCPIENDRWLYESLQLVNLTDYSSFNVKTSAGNSIFWDFRHPLSLDKRRKESGSDGQFLLLRSQRPVPSSGWVNWHVGRRTGIIWWCICSECHSALKCQRVSAMPAPPEIKVLCSYGISAAIASIGLPPSMHLRDGSNV